MNNNGFVYSPTDNPNNPSVESGKQKIILYGKENAAGVMQPTHVSLQMPDGSQTSKLGQVGPLIRYNSAKQVNGFYGAPVRVYVKNTGK